MTLVPSRPKDDIMVVMAESDLDAPYQILGISRRATGPEINEASRREAAKNNPNYRRASMSPAEAGRRSEKLRTVIEARDAITKRRGELIAAILEKIKGIKQEAV